MTSTPYPPKSYVPLPPQDPEATPNSFTLSQSSPKKDTEARTRVSWLRIYALCIANFGISGAWALEFAITTPYFEKGLKAGDVISHSVWVVGPLSGLIVAPIVGTLSDRCTSRFGRRRPFIFGGIVATIIGMFVFSQAREIASVIFAEGTSQHKWMAIYTALAAFCVMDLAINTTMWPAGISVLQTVRALQGDLVPDYQQHDLQSAAVVVGSFGELAANALIQSFEEPVTKIRLCFVVAAIFYTASTTVLLLTGKEASLTPDDPSIQDAQKQSLNIFDYLKGLPHWMWRVGVTYALGFFTLFCIMPNASTWVGSSVLGGDPGAAEGSKEAKAFEKGVNVYGSAGLIRAILQMLYSAVYPWLLKCMTVGQLLGTSFGLFSVLVLLLASTKKAIMAQIVVVAMALPMAAEFTLPVGITVENSDGSNRGRYLGALNCFAVIPQLIDTMYTGYISRAWGEAAVMRVCGVWGVLTTICAFTYMWV